MDRCDRKAVWVVFSWAPATGRFWFADSATPECYLNGKSVLRGKVGSRRGHDNMTKRWMTKKWRSFVNTHLKRSDRTAFQVVDHHWREPGSANRPLRGWLLAFLRDVGAGLDVHLYESVVTHFFAGEDAVLQEVDVLLDGQCLGRQKARLAAPNWAFKVTTIDAADLSRFEDHTRRFLQHTHLDGFHWINITRALVTFQSIMKP